MLKLATAAVLVASSLTLIGGPGASADTGPTHTLTVSGTDVGMYPTYDPTIRRYAATTVEDTYPSDATDNTTNHGASITVQATTSDPTGTVLVDGVPETNGQATLTDVSAGDEISVIYVDSGSREADSVYVLPADFPTMTATIQEAGITPGLVGVTLSQFQGNGWPNFDAVVDVNGVPAWSEATRDLGIDLKRQPDGSLSEARPTTAAGRTGSEIDELDSKFKFVAAHRTVDLTNTDNHDSILEPDGSMVLLAYEPNPVTGNTDSVIQELDPRGKVTFQWDSSALVDESVTGGADYAHINSIQIVDDGQDFLASFRNLSAVLLIAREAHDGYQPGDIIWRLGGRDSSFTFAADGFTPPGPCGQHSARQLPNGDIMVFDDGSTAGFGNLCVDPADPTGPVVPRPQSRLAVWHLDPGTGTATLVRSYAPSGWFSWFMGSAQYLPETGNILVGWAAATEAIATELAPDNTPIWQLEATPSSNGHSYFSYRSQKFAVPDTTDPAVDVTSPAEGATYAYGAAATADFSCTDTGGSTLQTCGDVLPGSALDTTTPGRHTFRVTATDGAGNTTTVARHYRVGSAPAVYRVDVAVKGPHGAWVGDQAYGPRSRQTTGRNVRPGAEVSVPFRLTNRGNTADRCSVSGTSPGAALGVAYRSDGRNVTAAVRSGRWRTPTLRPGASQPLTARVTATRSARRGAVRTFAVTCSSTHRAKVRDTAAVRVTVR